MRAWLAFARCMAVAVCLSAGPGVTPAAAEVHTVAEVVDKAEALLSDGRAGQALVLFGEVAARHPGYAPAEDGLHRALAHFGSPRRAEWVLRYFLAETRGHSAALLAAWQRLDRDRPLRFSGSVALLPSTNVEHVASQRYFVTDFGTFLIKDGGKESTGIGLSFEGTATAFLHPWPGHRFRLDASVAGVWFNTARLRFVEPQISLGYEHLGGRAPWSLSGFVSRRVYGGTAADMTADHVSRGLTYAQTWRLGQVDRLTLQLRGEYQRYWKQTYMSGPRYHLDLGRSQPLGGRARLSYGISLDRALPDKAYHRFTGVGLRLGYERPILKGVRGGLWLGLGEQIYDTAFPLLGKERRDRAVSVGVSMTLSRMKVFGQAPRVLCTARRSQSNVALYSTNSVDCSLSLGLAF